MPQCTEILYCRQQQCSMDSSHAALCVIGRVLLVSPLLVPATVFDCLQLLATASAGGFYSVVSAVRLLVV
jgi:hypothetical protein